jgi:RNA 3'-terminal phosphate cyclase (ATP)
MVTHVSPVTRLEAAEFVPVASREVHGVAAVSNLPAHIPQRMSQRATNLLSQMGFKPDIQPVRAHGAGPGAGIVLWLAQAGFSALGRLGLPAEKVAETAVNELGAFIDDHEAAVDEHLADQLLIPMALAHGRSQFTTNKVTRHTQTNADLLRQWLGVTITVDGRRLSVEGAGFAASNQ